jgi:broad specificity phosphatase PhoE
LKNKTRVGESEGSLYHKIKDENEDFELKEYENTHSSLWRLTEKGIEQTKKTGEWLNKNFSFDAFFTSEYVRALETSAYLVLFKII